MHQHQGLVQKTLFYVPSVVVLITLTISSVKSNLATQTVDQRSLDVQVGPSPLGASIDVGTEIELELRFHTEDRYNTF
jgi:hypothetical protein